ncbi:MAG: nitrile hydratase subunit beta [Gammaproteobacteria bacterium]|nr:nitrile hydratase subunit beta [Gammaproteobacteria bacterium]
MKGQYAVGATVRVRAHAPPGHLRTPYYCRGKTGTVVRVCGEFRNPEFLAYGEYDGPKEVLYRVAFPHKVLWEDYSGPAHDSVEIELYEHWLEASA